MKRFALNLPFAPKFSEIDRNLLIAWLALLGFGLVMVASASVSLAEKRLGVDAMMFGELFYFYRQSLYVALGLSLAAAVTVLPTQVWYRGGFALLATAVILLVLVLIPDVGREVNGARRWFAFPGFRLQPAEPARLFLLLYLCGYIVRRRDEINSGWRGLVKPLLPLGWCCLLLLLQPDLGSAAVLLAVSFGLLFLAGARLRYLLVAFASGAALLTVLIVTSPYRLRRLLSFSDPFADPYDSGFQLSQSLIAIGQGEFAGVGLGNSVQKLLYLPEMHTDFIFAIIAEELGFIGSAALVAGFLYICVKGMDIGRRCIALGNPFAGYVAIMVSLWICTQAFLNVAVNAGLLPTKGLTLPFISYGGSSLVTFCIAMGLLLRCSIELQQAADESPARKVTRGSSSQSSNQAKEAAS